MVDNYCNIFGTKPTLSFSSPLEKNDHPELDNSECLDSEGIKKNQSMIVTIQWAVYLGMLDVNTAVMNLASFVAETR